jgi:hypothetical protein
MMCMALFHAIREENITRRAFKTELPPLEKALHKMREPVV